MSLFAVVLVLASAFCHALWNVLSKAQQPNLAFFCLVSGFATSLLTPIAIIKLDSAWYILSQFTNLVLLTGCAQAAYFAGLAYAYRHGNFSITYPLARALPVIFTPVASYLFFELTLSADQFLCAGVILLGCVWINSAKSTDTNISLGLGGMGALVAALGTSAYSIIDQHALNQLSVSQSFSEPAWSQSVLYMWSLSLSSFLILLMIVFAVSIRNSEDLLSVLRTKKKAALSTSVIMTLTYSLVLIAMNFSDNVTYVVALRQISIVIGVMLGVIYFKESFKRMQLLGLSSIMVGIALMIPIT